MAPVRLGEQRAEPAALAFTNAPADELAARLKSFAAQSTGSSNLVRRMLVLEEPPSLDAGEMTDKGSINQRAVLERLGRQTGWEFVVDDPARVRALADRLGFRYVYD